MTGVLDLMDHVIADASVSQDAMRWSLDAVPDLRIQVHRDWPARRQATWRWWCETCRQPIPQPRWWWRGVPDGGVVLAGGMRAFHETIDPRTPWHPVVQRPAASLAVPPASRAAPGSGPDPRTQRRRPDLARAAKLARPARLD